MNLFKSKLMNRIAIAKTVGLVFWLVWFFLMPIYVTDPSLMLRFWVLFWYITMWWIIWLFWIMKKHPVFKIKIPFWFRGPFIWGWMYFVLTLFIYDKISILTQNTYMEWYSPFWIILEWVVFWLICDYIATKLGWEWKKLLK